MTRTTNRTRRATGLVASAAAFALLVAACGSNGDEPDATPTGGSTGTETTDGAPEPIDPPQIAFTTSFFPATYLNTRFGPIEYGPQLGMDFTEDDYTIFDGHATAMQALLSGSADVIGGSFISNVLLREQGQDLQIFCPFNNGDTLVLAGRNGVNTAEQLFDPNTRVAVDSPGGAGSLVFNALLEHLGSDQLVDDLPNTTILESSSLRATALSSDQVDASVIQMAQYVAMQDEVDDLELMASFGEDIDNVVMQAYAAPASWLEDNQETAISFCATILKANETLASDYDLFLDAAERFMPELPAAEVLELTFELIQAGIIWPTDLTDDAVQYTIDLGVRSGVLSEEQSASDVLNREILDAAKERAAELS